MDHILVKATEVYEKVETFLATIATNNPDGFLPFEPFKNYTNRAMFDEVNAHSDIGISFVIYVVDLAMAKMKH